jgi:hypothetical protein
MSLMVFPSTLFMNIGIGVQIWGIRKQFQPILWSYVFNVIVIIITISVRLIDSITVYILDPL